SFSQDNRWLVTGGATECRFWEVGSWKRGAVIARDYTRTFGGPGGPFALSKDGRVLALSRSQNQVQLFDMVKEPHLATLIAPDAQSLSRLRFNPDNAELAASTLDHMIRLWDLRAIRRQLREMNLDWESGD